MVDMADRPDIKMWFLTLKFLFAHLILLIDWPLNSQDAKKLFQASMPHLGPSPGAGLNRRPRPYQGRALPTELPGHISRGRIAYG
jgi:hypothetical protein